MEPLRCWLNGLRPWPFGTASSSSGQIEGTGAAPHNAQNCTDNSREALDQTWLPPCVSKHCVKLFTLIRQNLRTGEHRAKAVRPGSRGHLSVQVIRRHRPHQTSPRGDCGVALEVLSHCP